MSTTTTHVKGTVVKRLLKTAIVSMLVMSAAPAQSADERYYAVLNAKNPTRTVHTADVKALFMGTTSFWNGVVPVKLVGRSEKGVGAAFFTAVLGTNAQRFQQHWTTRQLAGLGTTPEMLDDITAVAGRVRSSPGAISVVSEAEVAAARALPGVKVLPIE
jgi:hypothetical protein